MTDEQLLETLRLLRVAHRAAHKLGLNRHVYKYDYMERISHEVVELECEEMALQNLLDGLGDRPGDVKNIFATSKKPP